ncbi:MAG: hypothetical protein KF778_11615 [Rhodocyclaceae bacterium]|nr:hypothetical protein [Rhodocyclaceae bacterium]MBX3669043.1 hypothetical protein [Rhodocyclaceae bacterium]
MLAWLDKLIDQLFALVPAAWGRSYGYFLRNYPLFWRSHLLPMFAFTVPLALASAAAGLPVPMDTRTLWTQDDIGRAFSLYMMVMGVLAAIWMRAVLRFPLGERPLSDHLRATVYAFVALAALLAPPLAFYGGLSATVASVMAPQRLQDSYDYLASHDFWCCTKDIDTDLYATERERLSAALAQFGLATRGRIFWGRRTGLAACPLAPESWKYLEMTDAAGNTRPGLLRARVETLRLHQHYGAGGVAHVINAAMARFARWSLVAAAIAFGMGIAAIPGCVWRRIQPRSTGFVQTNRRRPRWTALPRFLQRLDRKLLLHRPAVWALAVHRAVPLVTVINVLCLVSIAAVGGVSAPARTAIRALAPLAAGLLSLLVWLLLFRAHAIAVTEPQPVRKTVFLFLTAVMLLPLRWTSGWLIVKVEFAGPDFYFGIFASAVAVFFAAAYITPAALVANFAGWPAATISLVAASFAVLGIVAYFGTSAPVEQKISLAILFGLTLSSLMGWAVRRARAGRLRTPRAHVLIHPARPLGAMCHAIYHLWRGGAGPRFLPGRCRTIHGDCGRARRAVSAELRLDSVAGFYRPCAPEMRTCRRVITPVSAKPLPARGAPARSR